MNTATFKEDTHQYFYMGKEFISVTTLIKEYAGKFDSKHWSTYKAVKDVMEYYNEWTIYKKQAGGWENVVNFWSSNPTRLDEILDRKKYYLDLWEEEGRVARVKGTLAHNEKEQEIKGHITSRTASAGEFVEVPLGINEAAIMEGDFDSQGVFAELLVWNEAYGVAGQVDKVIKRKKHIDLEDYKTNKKLATVGFRGAMMKYPLNSLPDCNISHYQIQLSLYAWMLQKRGYHIGKLIIRHIPDSRTDIPIEVEYRPDLVELMLNHYAKRRKIFQRT